MLTGIHVLLSYTCLWQCDHCFLYCSPTSGGTFTFRGLEQLLDQAVELGTVQRIVFEGGEPFLFYPLLRQGIQSAVERGFEAEVVTNGYWALDSEDAVSWLEPLVDAGLSILDVSDDKYHHGDADPSPAVAALAAGRELGLRTAAYTIDPPEVRDPPEGRGKGDPIVGGGVRFRGRAAEKLAEGLPVRDARVFTECPDEDFITPCRVHADAQGHLQLCQGISIGNWRASSLAGVIGKYDPRTHPVCGPLLRSGPVGLAEEYGVEAAGGYVDACMLCCEVRKQLRTQFPDCLCPGQAYGE